MSARTTPTVTPTLSRDGDKATLVFDARLLDSVGLAQGTPVRVGVSGGHLVVEVDSPAAMPEDRAAALKAATTLSHERYAETYRKLAE